MSTTTAPPATTTTVVTTVVTTFITNLTTRAPNATNSTATETEWEFLLSAFIILVVASSVCGTIICVCKGQTRDARLRREEAARAKDSQRRLLDEAAAQKAAEDERLREERDEQVRRELGEQEEIEQARKEGREVDAVYNRDDVFYANVADVSVYVEHPSSLVETGVAALDHHGNPKPRAGDVSYSQVKTTDATIDMVNDKTKRPPVVFSARVISGVDFYRNQYERTVAQQLATAAADAADAARRNSQPYTYRKSKARRGAGGDGVALGEDWAGGEGGAGGGDGAGVSLIAGLPWLGKQNLSAFDADAFERAFAPLPDDDEQEELDRRRLAQSADVSQSVHARVTGHVLADGLGASRTTGGGGAAKLSLLEAPTRRAAREEAEAAAQRVDEMERKKHQRQLELAKRPVKKGQTKVVVPPEPPAATARRLVIAPHLKLDNDKEAYYASLL